MSYPDWLPEPPEGMWWQMDIDERGRDILSLNTRRKKKNWITGKPTSAVVTVDWRVVNGRYGNPWERVDVISRAHDILRQYESRSNRRAIREEVNNAKPA